MNVLLVYPEFPDATFWKLNHALRFIRKKAGLPPLGLITVAAMLPREWKVRLVDMNVSRLTDADLEWADYVFIGAMVAQRESVKQVIGRCRLAKKKIVAGGPLFTSEYESFPEMDHFVLNEAEITLPLFLADLKQDTPQYIYRTDQFADLEQTPIPRWDLLKMRAYATMSLQWSRGCPFDCEFCEITLLFGHRTRVKSAERLIAELDSLIKAGWKGTVFLADDNSIGNKHRFKYELLPALIAWQKKTGHRVLLSTEVSVNLAQDQELINLMVKAGFDSVFIGIETPNQDALAECGKKQNQGQDLAEAVRILQRSGLMVKAGFIVGFDADDPKTIFQRLFEFIMQSGTVMAMVGMLNAPPDTRLWQRLKQSNRLRGEISGDNTDCSTNIDPLMGMEKLRNGYRNLMRQLYAPGNYYRRLRTFLRMYRTPNVRRVCQRLDLQRCLAFFRASWRLGLIGRDGWFGYWTLLIWVFFRKPRLLPMAVELAIYGFHFRMVAARIQ